MAARRFPSPRTLRNVLDELDPGGDAIQVQVSAQSYAASGKLVKGPAHRSAEDPNVKKKLDIFSKWVECNTDS